MDSEEEEEQEFKEKLQQWKRTGTGTGAQPKKVKYVYKTADQVLQAYHFFEVSIFSPFLVLLYKSPSHLGLGRGQMA